MSQPGSIRQGPASMRLSLRRVTTLAVGIFLFLAGLGVTRAGFATAGGQWLYEEGASYVRMGNITSVTYMRGDKPYTAWIPDLRYQPDPQADEDLARFRTMPERAYTLDFRHAFHRITPLHENSYTLDEMNRLQGLESLPDEAVDHIRWILKHSMPYVETPEECAALARLPELSENDVVVATQLAIWRVVTGMSFRAQDLAYPNETPYMLDFYNDLINYALEGDTAPRDTYINNDVRFAQIEIQNGGKRGDYYETARGRYGPFKIQTSLPGVETCQVWIEDMTPAESGTVLEDKKRGVTAKTSEAEPSRTDRLEVDPGDSFYVNTMGAMTPSGEITIRVRNRIKISYESELMIWGTVNENNRRQNASLVTAGLFVSKPSDSIRIRWGSDATLELPVATSIPRLDLEGNPDNIVIVDDMPSSILMVPDSDDDMLRDNPMSIDSILQPVGDEVTPDVLIMPRYSGPSTFSQWIQRLIRRAMG